MELRQLRYFVAVAQTLNFTRAAQVLHVSQPPLSYQIAQLEDDLGVRLFERTSRTVTLTEAGRAFWVHAQAMLDRADEARNHMSRLAAGLCGRVQIGLAGSHFLGPFPHFIRQWRSERPQVEVLLHEMQPTDHLRALQDGRLDLSLSRQDQAGEGLRAQLLWPDPVVAVVPPGDRLADFSPLDLAALASEEFVFLRLGSSPFAARSHQACVQAGFAPRIVQQVVEIPAMLNLVAAGLGVALVPESLTHNRGDAVRVCSLRLPIPKDGSPFTGDVYLHGREGESHPVVAEFTRQLLIWAATKAPGRPG